jgi:hypothetical protein
MAQRAKEAARRRQVWEFHVDRKLPMAQIAEALGVSVSTVERDLRQTNAETRAAVFAAFEDEAAVIDFATKACSNLDAVERQAWNDLIQAGAGSSERARYLLVIQANIVHRVKVLQSMGLVKKVAEEFLVHHGATKASGLSDAELDDIIAFYHEALARGETPGSRPDPAPGPDAVDGSEPVDP